MSAEYIMGRGQPTGSSSASGVSAPLTTYTRNTLDLSAVLAVKQLSRPAGGGGPLPRLRQGVDGGAHESGGGSRRGGRPHHRGAQRPAPALCDGAQSITPAQFDTLMGRLTALAPCVGREL